MPSASNELRVVSLCSYLTGDLKARSIDWPAIKMVKALKGDPINGYFELLVDGVTQRFDKNNVGQFLDMVPRAMAAAILPRIEGTATWCLYSIRMFSGRTSRISQRSSSQQE